MISRSKILGTAFVGASLFAFALPAGAQTAPTVDPSNIPADCLASDGTLMVNDQNSAQCAQYDSTSSVLPPNSAVHDDSTGTGGNDLGTDAGAPAGAAPN